MAGQDYPTQNIKVSYETGSPSTKLNAQPNWMRWALPDKPSFNWLQIHHKVKQKWGGQTYIWTKYGEKDRSSSVWKSTKSIQKLTTCLIFDDDGGGGGRYVKWQKEIPPSSSPSVTVVKVSFLIFLFCLLHISLHRYKHVCLSIQKNKDDRDKERRLGKHIVNISTNKETVPKKTHKNSNNC